MAVAQKQVNPKMACPGKWLAKDISTCGPIPGVILTHTHQAAPPTTLLSTDNFAWTWEIEVGLLEGKWLLAEASPSQWRKGPQLVGSHYQVCSQSSCNS